MRGIVFLFSLFIAIIIISNACQKDSLYKGDSPNFSLTTDTISFDTVFTSRGSTTKFVKLRNEEDEIVSFDVSLGKETEFFRMNVDGIPTETAEDVEILPGDSIYIFVEVTIDPDQPLSISPFIINDYILIQSGKLLDTLHLEAWGQNANYIPGPNRRGLITILSCDLQTIKWDDPKPYVINGLLVIDSCTLEIPQGTDIYVSGGYVNNNIGVYQDGIIIFQNKGKLHSYGTKEEPVTFQGARLEDEFDQVAGQWNGIRFLGQSQGNKIEHTIIKNAGISLYVDSLSELSIKHSTIINSSSYGLLARHAHIDAENSVFAISGQPAVNLFFGGNYSFEYCTIANIGSRTAQGLSLSNFGVFGTPDNPTVVVNDLNFNAINTIIYSETEESLILSPAESSDPSTMNYRFDHSAIVYKDLIDDYPEFSQNCVNCYKIDKNRNLFVDKRNFDFHLDSLAQVDSLAVPTNILIDIEEKMRHSEFPDIGAYELINE